MGAGNLEAYDGTGQRMDASEMSIEMLLAFSILGISMALLVTRWIPMEVTALLVLGSVALTGLLPPAEALAGFSNPAVVTIWAVFILSGGLTHTGVADAIGRIVLRIAGSHEIPMIMVIMATAGFLSAIMNNVAVAALMLPVVMDIARNTGMAPSRLLMPLAYATLLGGMTTQIGKPSNILVTEALRESGLEPFSFFSFTPVGLIVMLTGIAFMALVGRHLLPGSKAGEESKSTPGEKTRWQNQYDVEDRLFHIRVPSDSTLAGKPLSTIRFGPILGWNVICITRNGDTIVLPGPEERLMPGDLLTVEGRMENLEVPKNLLQMKVEKAGAGLEAFYPGNIGFCEVNVPARSTLAGNTLNTLQFHARFNTKVLAVRTHGQLLRMNLQDMIFAGGELLLLAGEREQLEKVESSNDFENFRHVDAKEISDNYGINEDLALMEVSGDSEITGKTLAESHLGEIIGSHILGIIREGKTIALPEPSEVLRDKDRLIMELNPSLFQLLEGIESLWIYEEAGHAYMTSLLSRNIGLVEAILAPGASIEGKTLRQLNFREKYGLIVLALWRRRKTYRSNLRDMALDFGDSMLVFGTVKKLQLLGQEPDFIVLTRIAQEAPRTEKMPISISIMAAILFFVVMGWIPIYIAAVTGAAIMIATGCLSMEEAYRQIEWKAVFLIAGMLSLADALEQTGAAMMVAQKMILQIGPLGPEAVLFGLVALTILATCFIPMAAVVVLMIPVALNTAATMGLSPHSLMMAITMAASASFITPISHPSKLLVMGPGGYGFMDYLKAGLPMTFVVVGVLMLSVLFFWPLVP